MLFHDVLSVCFAALLAPKIEANAQVDSKPIKNTKPEALFADVIKNISRVNNELQHLINNYEQFKKTHTSQEDFDVKKAYGNDAEGGRVNRNSKTHDRKPSDKITTNSYQTEMIFVENEADKSSEIETNSETKSSSQKQKSHEVDGSHEEESKEPIENTVKNKQKIQTTTRELRFTNKERTDEPLHKEESESKNQDFSDIHNDMKIKTDRLKRILSEAYQDNNQTKYKENEKQTKYLGGKNPQVSESEISAESKRHTEEREEMVVPEKPQERAFEETQVEVTAGVYLRSLLGENATTTTKKPGNASLESSENEDLSKDVFKTDVLRQAYGDACLKLVIRKCHKACKAASTSACRAAIKCKSEFKTYFKEKSKKGCLGAFQRTSLRRIAESKPMDGAIITQEGYLSVACQTPIRRNLEKPKPGQNLTNSLNILRDKYERACSKISQKKCTTACHNALNISCEKYDCKKTLKKNFKKHCRTHCKRFYSSKSISSSSDDDDDDDDDSDSDYDSDDDDDSYADSSDDDDDDDNAKRI